MDNNQMHDFAVFLNENWKSLSHVRKEFKPRDFFEMMETAYLLIKASEN